MPARSQQPIVHYATWLPKQPVMAVEYPLPGDVMPLSLQREIDPWIRNFIGTTEEGARALLRSRWEDLVDAPLIKVREYLLRFDPCSVVVHEGATWLALAEPGRASVKDLEVGEAWFLPGPPAAGVLESQLQRYSLESIDGLSCWLRAFSGLREFIPNYSGHFLQPREWESVQRLVDDWETAIEGIWAKAIMFYESRAGDILLLAPTGATAWWCHDVNEIVPLKDSFVEFVNHYAEHMTSQYPFSSWESPSRGG